MKSGRRLHSLTRICTSASILKLNRILKRAISWNVSVSKNIKSRSCNYSIITCGINRINIIEPNNNVRKDLKESKRAFMLSFYICLSDSLYHIKSRISLKQDLVKSRTFYTLPSSLSILLSTISDKNLQKIVYKNGIDVIFNFKKYFGINLKNIYDIKHLTKMYSIVNKQQSPEEYGEYIRNQYGPLKNNQIVDFIINESNKFNKNSNHESCLHKEQKLDTNLYLNENTFENRFPFKYIDKLRIYLYRKYNIINETFNLKMETMYNDIKNKPRLYRIKNKNQLDYGSLNAKIFEEKFFSSILNKEYPVEIVTEPGPFYGIVTDIIEPDQNVTLNINSYIVDEIKREVFPLYGKVNPESFKYFTDKKIGDVVECVERDSKEIKISFKEGRAYIQLKRLHQESLIYSLRNKRYVPINEISFSK